MALLLELGSYTTTMSYNFVRGYSYLSYLEYPILLIQEYVLIYCVLKYNGMLNSRTTIYALLYVGIAGLFLTQTIPPSVLTMLLVSRRMEIRLKDVNDFLFAFYPAPLHSGRSHEQDHATGGDPQKQGLEHS